MSQTLESEHKTIIKIFYGLVVVDLQLYEYDTVCILYSLKSKEE